MALRRIELPDGRRFAVDEVGDAAGTPVVYLHGTPDSRLARHPDDAIAERAGVRLLAVDRPGAGDSDPDPAADGTSLGRDLIVLLDALGIHRTALLGWSSGGLAALGAATVLGFRAGAITLVGSLPPAEAYADPVLVAALGAGRRSLVEMGAELGAAAVAAEGTPFLVPTPLTPALALEHVLEAAGPVGRAELAGVPGAAEALAAGLEAGVARGLGWVEQDLRLQLTPGIDLGGVVPLVRLVHGELDDGCPPAVGEWLEDHLPRATLEIVPGAGHHLLFPHWGRLLAGLVG